MRALLCLLALAACGGSKPAPTSVPPSQDKPAPAGSQARPTPSPYDASVWIGKLDDPRELERAVTELEQLGDPSAIVPLGKAWLREGRPVRLLQVLISLARPLTPEQAKAMYVTDYEKTGRPASWDKALPFLNVALVEVDETNPRSVDSATKAADALGEARLGAAALIDITNRPPSKKLIVAQVAALRALSQFAGNADVVRALVRVISREPPMHPRLATDRETQRTAETNFGLYLGTTGAAVNALAALGDPGAAIPLVLTMYRTPELFTQVRRSLVAVGAPAKTVLRDALRGKQAQVNELFKARKLDRYCGDRGDQSCQPVSARMFYAAVVLGDFYDPAVVPDLLDALKQPPLPPYYIDDQPAPNTHYNAVFDALAKIGDRGAGPVVRKIMLAPKEQLMTRSLAISAYPFVATDTQAVKALVAIAADNAADDQLRMDSALAVSRLSTDDNDIAAFDQLAKKYLDASDKKTKEAAKQDKTVAAADAELEAAKQAHAAAKGDAQAEQTWRAAKKAHRDKVTPHKQAMQAAKAYLGYARMFQTHVARIEIAKRCKADTVCYVRVLQQSPDDVASNNARYIRDLEAWTVDEKLGLYEAAVDRAMLELGKAGAKASAHTEALLDAASTENRMIRSAILRALPKLAPSPCTSCVAKLDLAIAAGEGKTTLGDLTLETTILRHYFAASTKAP